MSRQRRIRYDANGNVTQAGGWSYVWDYLNRMLASGYNNSTTTYAYDATGARVLQTSTTSTTYYPSKFFSLASTTSGGTSWATSTNYIWLGDTLLGDDRPKALQRHGDRHRDHPLRPSRPPRLDQRRDGCQRHGRAASSTTTLMARRASLPPPSPPTRSGNTSGNSADAQTNLDYLNARYYDSGRGQFLTVEPVVLNLGDREQLNKLTQMDQQTLLTNPQLLNSYTYGRDNPILYKDPTGKFIPEAIVGGGIGGIVGLGIQGASDFVTWHYSGPEAYVGAFAGGATYGGLVGATDGLSLVPACLQAEYLAQFNREQLKDVSMLDGSQQGFNYGDFGKAC